MAEQEHAGRTSEGATLSFDGSEVELGAPVADMGDGRDILLDHQALEEEEGIVIGGGADGDYQELLDRVFNILAGNNPDLAVKRGRMVMCPPKILREGTRKTVFVNFMESCKTLRREPNHVMDFFLSEMATSGSIDGQHRLVIKGRFAPKSFESILRRYINAYVICNGCKGHDTTMTKENRLLFLRCEQCGSSRSVDRIKAGYIAHVGRRNA
ncbi:eukaryotic translation initiation factor 2 subunit beta-like [Hordeum vulgare subsp. vulgare]|uniref:Eukaryotic translation initiation factor 2 subunit beta n=1 Tax=Hordeum vulgare subsp. vulgare TaxID=112509 RepID=F2ECH9_HORVV|nr:eukaryotic translation initiation factor 2 subunit beta-like [Hordeum vulgare subsp. vulgare]BAK05051.1 predicted protein [Hordeum vulgare subsp. vulgare]